MEEDREALQRARKGSSTRIVAVVGAVVVVGSVLGYGVFAGWFNPASSVTLVGAGATFPYPLIAEWSNLYENNTGVKINYQAIGSGGGISQITQKTVDFAGSDAPLNLDERAAAPGLLHIPETIGAVVFAYNVQGVATGLALTGEVVADIFQGDITSWDHPAISDLNPGFSLPAQDITVVHRSDGSGTTFVWTSYLAEVSSSWATDVGAGKSVSWPTGIGQPGNSGVAGAIQQTPYSAGYVELAYAEENDMTVAKIQNPEGQFIMPSLAAVAAAAAGASVTLPNAEDDWSDVSILNAPGAESYPISSFTYLLVYKELNVLGSSMTQSRASALLEFLWWVIHDGQDYSEALLYAPLPQSVVSLNEDALRSVTFDGQPVLS